MAPNTVLLRASGATRAFCDRSWEPVCLLSERRVSLRGSPPSVWACRRVSSRRPARPPRLPISAKYSRTFPGRVSRSGAMSYRNRLMIRTCLEVSNKSSTTKEILHRKPLTICHSAVKAGGNCSDGDGTICHIFVIPSLQDLCIWWSQWHRSVPDFLNTNRLTRLISLGRRRRLLRRFVTMEE